MSRKDYRAEQRRLHGPDWWKPKHKAATPEPFPPSFFGYDEILWSATGPEPMPSKRLIPAPSYVVFRVLATGKTEAQAEDNLRISYNVVADDIRKFRKGSWIATHSVYTRVEKGTWGEIKAALHRSIAVVGGSDHVFYEGMDPYDGQVYDGLPVYSPAMGS